MEWGTLAAMIAASHTFFLWEHPYAAIILTFEALVVGWWLRRKRQNLLVLDGFYWILIGMPLVWLFYDGVMGVQDQAVLLIMLKQSVNGMFNALIASLLLTHSPISNWLARPKAVKTISLQQTLFNLLVAFIFFPALTLMVLHSRSALSTIETTIHTNLQHQSKDVVVELRSWHQQTQKALQQLADIAARWDGASSIALQQSTELLQRTFPDFHQLFIINEAGKAIASYPARGMTTANATQLKALDLTQPLITSAAVSLGDATPSLMLIQSVPVMRNNRLLGSVVSQSSLNLIDQRLNSLRDQQELEITLLDRQERVIASTRSDQPTLEAFDSSKGGDIYPINAKVYQWLPIGKMPIMIRWKNSFYVQRTPTSNELPWTVIVEAPTQPHFDYLQNLYINSLAIMLVITVLALLLANMISYWLAKPLWRLAVVTTDVPDKLLDQKAIVWPTSWVREINTLVDNFKCMAGTLEQKFQEIKSAKEQLEKRVQERTKQLSTANQELESEVAERKRVAEALQQSEALLRAQAEKLEKALHELQHAQAQLVQTEKMSSLGQLVAGVAHEINNPVNFIYGNLIHAKGYTQDLFRLVQVYQQQYPNPTRAIHEEIEAIELEYLRKDLPKLLDSMQVGTERIHQIVKSLRNFSRVDESERKAVDIHEGIESTLMILQSRLKAKPKHLDIKVIKEYGDLPLVECYPSQLNQVFMNILSNAIDALEQVDTDRFKLKGNAPGLATASLTLMLSTQTHRQSTSPWIRIRTEVDEGYWAVIRIADNGIGITKELASKMFDPFFTTKSVGQGTGLGLSISYQIVVERHGGKLYCISEPGQGTELIIKIPQG
jgi:signal transduction histidine kinase